jgi:hypothetical protein
MLVTQSYCSSNQAGYSSECQLIFMLLHYEVLRNTEKHPTYLLYISKTALTVPYMLHTA